MAEHKITLEWKRETDGFTYDTYNRNHTWVTGGGAKVVASAAPAYRGNPAQVNPEEAFVAALSSCHMLTFLAMAAKKKFIVDRYSDPASG
ncbi:MAG: OsmC family protein, partial [Nitrospira sp.]|nr:OsmC family protein [Nitrospira sp.]